ncbi:MAG: NAD-dependent epimerase/dehydratase family protein [Spartobacteria bacterium]|nr:NAD-dependent epimerase/dehydratase family protein [Spartobacteria bacterium]
MKKYFITGGAGFIGGHMTNYILDNTDASVTVFDNFSTGRRWHFGERVKDPRLVIVEADAQDEAALLDVMAGHDMVYHFAANSDIASAQVDPTVDFRNGTIPTNNVLEAMRKTGVSRMAFTSGSGVYGEVPQRPIPEDYDRMIPVSTYGACKLAGESLISAYSFMFDMTGTVLRFANVVGPNQTHGVAHDFIMRLRRDPAQLKIFGDGTQCKPYIFIDDVIAAFRMMEEKQTGGYDVFNVGTPDHLTVTEIADIVCERMGLKGVAYNYTGGSRGWKADVPYYQLNTDKVRSWGWNNRRNSREAVEASVDAMLEAVASGKYDA